VTALARRTVIVGTGLIGGSLAASGRRAGALEHVVGVGRGRDNLDHARAAGLVDETSTDLAGSLDGADLVVLAAPVDACCELLETVATHTGERCVVTDVGSVKVPLVERATALGIASRFVAAHPMAGGVDTGAAAARADLFDERVVVLTPNPATAAEAVGLVRRLWEACGARVVEMDAAAHDAAVAVTSHLPQMLAFCLSAAAGRDAARGEHLEELVGAGFKDTARLARSDAAMWAAIARLNGGSILAAMDRFSAVWQELRAAIEAGDEQALRVVMSEAAAFKSRVDDR